MTAEIRPDLARVFDQIGSRYSDAFSDKPGQVAAGAWVAERILGGPPGHHPIVLDVGCGTGLPTARQLIDLGCDVVGIDASPVMLDEAHHNVPEAIFIERELGDLDGLHPVGQHFDAAVAFFSLLVLPRAQIGPVLDAVHRQLRPGAPFAVGMVEGDTDFLLREFLGTQVPLTAYPRKDLAELIESHGFTVQELTAESWDAATPRLPVQTHLYARTVTR